MADIHLSSGKREQEIRETFRHPLVLGCIAIFFVVLSMTFSHPLSDFIHEHHQFFYVSLTIGTIPFGIFIFVLYSQYGKHLAELCHCFLLITSLSFYSTLQNKGS